MTHLLCRCNFESLARLVLCLWVGVFVSGTPRSLTARDIYVDNVAGDDLRDGSLPVTGGGSSGPCQTIRRALQLASKSDRIILTKNEVPYRESITLQAGRHSGVPGFPFTIEGNGAVLDGTQPVPPTAWEHVGGAVFRFRPKRLAHQLLYRDGVPAPRVPVSGSELPVLQPGEWSMFNQYLHFRVDQDRLPHHYALALTALPVGITLYEVRHVKILQLRVQGYQLDGVNAHDNALDVSLVGLTCRGNARAGICVGGASHVTLQACLLGNNGAAQVRTEGESRTSIVNCDLLENTAPAVVRDGGYVTLVGKAAAQP